MSSLISKQQQVSCHHYFGSAHGNLRATELTPCINSSSLSRVNQSASSDVIGVEKRRNGAVGHTLFICGDLVLQGVQKSHTSHFMSS